MGLEEKDTDVQRLYWYDNLKDRKITEFRCTRVILVATSSPYVLGAKLQKHFAKYVTIYPETVHRLIENTYVGDIIAGCNSIEELERFKKEAITIIGDANMKLHKWKSNAKAL